MAFENYEAQGLHFRGTLARNFKSASHSADLKSLTRLLPIAVINQASDLKLRARLPLKWTTQRAIINSLCQ